MMWALALFSAIRMPIRSELTRARAVRALRLIPLVGLLLGALASLPLVLIASFWPQTSWLAALLTVTALVMLTRALHLDGLADTVDGIGANKPAERGLAIMRQSDIGPFGVIALILALGAQITALQILSRPIFSGGIFSGDASFGWTSYAPLAEVWPIISWVPLVALATAAAAGRACALIAARRSIPPAHDNGFGALVAASQGPASVLVTLVATTVGAGVAGWAVGYPPWAWAAIAAIALAATTGLLHKTIRRFGGVTGDIFGAVIVVGTTICLIGFALWPIGY